MDELLAHHSGLESPLYKMKIHAVIFDLDGTIVDTEPLQQLAFNQLLEKNGIDYCISEAEYGRVFVGVSVRENAEWLIRRFGLPQTQDEIRDEHYALYLRLIADPKNLSAMSGLMPLLANLRSRDIARGVATGSPRDHAEIVLRGLGIESHFRAVVTGSDISKPKPDPEIYLRALAALNVAAEDAIALEDSAAGIAAAKAAGLFAVAVPNRYTAQQDLSRADARVENLGQVVEIIA